MGQSIEVMINRNTTIISELHTTPVEIAIANLKRDINKACEETKEPGSKIVLVKTKQAPECFHLVRNKDQLEIQASDELGFIYGIYEISRRVLGILPFWFWNDQVIQPKKQYVVTEDVQSKPFAVRYRGWFVNDEVLLLTWSINGRKDLPWKMVFEALLRCGGNMVIPGTDEDARRNLAMAADMGLAITHHHAEPLGAEMFARAYPDLVPSYELYQEKFHTLWKEAIERQKERKVIWSLGFRGQGDCPFWENDPQYASGEARGKLMGDIIKMQYDLVKSVLPDAVCCTNLYGETMELYNDGQLELPKDVIKIWADNGYGKMVTRRQGNHNPRVYALPNSKGMGCHGIYYHVSFYDLQAANHITMLQNSPEFIAKELGEVVAHGADDFWLVNCSNVKPHVYFLDLISNMWRETTVDVSAHRMQYVKDYYGTDHAEQIAACFKAYPKYAVSLGKHEDEHAGEQFVNHIARILVSQYLKEKNVKAEELLWATHAVTLKEQILWYKNLCQEGREGYKAYKKQCEATAAVLSEEAEILFRDSLLVQATIYEKCYRGASYVCESLLAALWKNYKEAFYLAGKAREEYLAANKAMRDREHGKWKGFYQNECLTDVKQTAWVLEGLMSYLRTLGEGPHFYEWQREFLYPEEDRKILLLLNKENHLKDEELFALMEQRWGQ